jgi:hypothetical protein
MSFTPGVRLDDVEGLHIEGRREKLDLGAEVDETILSRGSSQCFSEDRCETGKDTVTSVLQGSFVQLLESAVVFKTEFLKRLLTFIHLNRNSVFDRIEVMAR